jgi:hypothetical protein
MHGCQESSYYLTSHKYTTQDVSMTRAVNEPV